MDTSQTFGAPLSGLPPLAYLSGLNLGQGGLSGAQDPSLGGSGGTQRSLTPGATGGLGLDELSALLAAQAGDTSGTVGAVGATPFSLQTLGQQPTQTGGYTGGYGIAGQTAAPGGGMQTAQGSAAGSADPMAIIQKLLGLGSKGLSTIDQLMGGQSAVGQPGGIGTSDINRSGGTGGYTTGIASPTIDVNQMVGTPGTYGAAIEAQGGAEGLRGLGQMTPGASITPDMTLTNIAGQTSPIQGLYDLAQSMGLSNDQITQILGSAGVEGLGSTLSGQGFEQMATGGSASPYGGSGGLTPPSAGPQGGMSGLGAAASGIGGIANLLGAIQGFQSGTGPGALSGGQSLLGTLQALNALAQGTAAGQSVLAASPALSAVSQALSAASGPLAAVAPFIQAAIAYLGTQEEKNARESGWANNPIAGAMLSGATSGVGRNLGLLQQLQQAGGVGQADTQTLMQALPQLVNNLGPYFATAQGPKGPIRASTALTGMFGRPGIGGEQQYTANEQQAQQGVMDTINELMRRGVTYEQLGQLPVSQAFGNQTMDMYNPLQDLYGANAAKYNQTAQPLLQSIAQTNRQMLDPQEAMRMEAAGQNPASFGYTQDASGNWFSAPRIATGNSNGDFYSLQPGQLTPDVLFNAAQGAGYFGAPDSATKAGGLTSAMYGGPLWQAIARMGGQGNPLWAQIQQHFNPWATVGGFSPQQLTASIQPILQSMVAGGDTGGAIGSTPGEATGGI